MAIIFEKGVALGNRKISLLKENELDLLIEGARFVAAAVMREPSMKYRAHEKDGSRVIVAEVQNGALWWVDTIDGWA